MWPSVFSFLLIIVIVTDINIKHFYRFVNIKLNYFFILLLAMFLKFIRFLCKFTVVEKSGML
ncbi:MAG TPA: hypothetical protein DHW25_00940 [Blautia sp.]|nr:hypothetical protein [Blautia sp.]